MHNDEEMPRQMVSPSARWGLAAVAVLLLTAAAVGGFYFVREHRQAKELATRNQTLSANLSQVQGQLQALSDKLNALTAAKTAPATPSRPSASSPHARVKTASHRTAAVPRRPEDPRFTKIQQQLSDQQKQLASTRDEVEKTRADLDGKLTSTRTELNGSIARTHEELVALEKRGERNYYEFTVDKSKRFQRVGPVSLSLRKVNFKHKSFNLALMVDDFQLEKKNVNVYEPVLITLPDRQQPLELVVNQVHNDEVRGYLSEPKYKKSELAAANAVPGDKTPQVPPQP